MVNYGSVGWRGGRAGVINGGVMGGPPVLVGPGWTTARVTGVVCFLKIDSIWVGQFQNI